jgi:hypothetical protein
MFLLPLLFSVVEPDYTLLKCDQYDWLRGAIGRSSLLSRSEKIDLTFLFIESTDPQCFEE